MHVCIGWMMAIQRHIIRVFHCGAQSFSYCMNGLDYTPPCAVIGAGPGALTELCVPPAMGFTEETTQYHRCTQTHKHMHVHTNTPPRVLSGK